MKWEGLRLPGSLVRLSGGSRSFVNKKCLRVELSFTYIYIHTSLFWMPFVPNCQLPWFIITIIIQNGLSWLFYISVKRPEGVRNHREKGFSPFSSIRPIFFLIFPPVILNLENFNWKLTWNEIELSLWTCIIELRLHLIVSCVFLGVWFMYWV